MAKLCNLWGKQNEKALQKEWRGAIPKNESRQNRLNTHKTECKQKHLIFMEIFDRFVFLKENSSKIPVL